MAASSTVIGRPAKAGTLVRQAKVKARARDRGQSKGRVFDMIVNFFIGRRHFTCPPPMGFENSTTSFCLDVLFD
jgi:hypothetical protein